MTSVQEETREGKEPDRLAKSDGDAPLIQAIDEPQDEASALEKVTSHAEDYPQGLKLVLILLSIYLSIFLVALDRTIIATALPRITDHFHSFGDIGWVCSYFPRRHAEKKWLTKSLIR